jgi:SAM-dependent methyltransferase
MTPYWDNGPVQLYQADARTIPLSDQSVHCVVTSPPYFGLRVYKDNDDRGIGLESTVEDYIGNLVDVFREVRRVLRDDGVAWLNLGDSYGDGGDRLGIPERVVLALQADGWIWRDTIIWAKKSSMPESLAGWRWERCRVKVSAEEPRKQKLGAMGMRDHSGETMLGAAQYQDCPGCPKCADNDGLVLRRGSWRTTSAHEYIYMLTKGMGYYADGEAVKTAALMTGHTEKSWPDRGPDNGRTGENMSKYTPSTANRRSVWNDISPEPYGGSHFATFPSDLPRICIQASTSERGCCSECGSQWARVVEHSTSGRIDHNTPENGGVDMGIWSGRTGESSNSTLGWRPTCNHNAPAIPATVLDPFSGTATTCRAAQKLGRRAVGVDISESYLEQAVRRLSAVTLPMGI